jgi:hypothetical protein
MIRQGRLVEGFPKLAIQLYPYSSIHPNPERKDTFMKKVTV